MRIACRAGSSGEDSRARRRLLDRTARRAELPSAETRAGGRRSTGTGDVGHARGVVYAPRPSDLATTGAPRRILPPGDLVDLNRPRWRRSRTTGAAPDRRRRGTGKTTVITRRIAHLIATRRRAPRRSSRSPSPTRPRSRWRSASTRWCPTATPTCGSRRSTPSATGSCASTRSSSGLTPDFRVLNRAEQVIFLRDRLFELPLEHFRPLGDPTRHLQALIALVRAAPRTRTSRRTAYLAHAEALAADAAAHPEDAERRELAARSLELARDLRAVPGR